MSDLYLYGGKFFENWFLYMTAGPFVTDEILLRLFPKFRKKLGVWISKTTRRRIEVALLLIGVFYSGFAAFKEEHEARESAENALKTKPVPIQITEIDPEARKKLTEQDNQIEELKNKLREAERTIASQKPVERHLTNAQRKILVNALKDAGSCKIAIRLDPQNPETQAYSEQFASLFWELGWKTVEPKFLIHNKAEKGLRVLVHDANHPPAQSSQLIDALRQAGISVIGQEVPPIQEDVIELMIGFPEDSTPPSPTPGKEASPR